MGGGVGKGVGDGCGEECFTYKSQELADMSEVEFFNQPSGGEEVEVGGVPVRLQPEILPSCHSLHVIL